MNSTDVDKQMKSAADPDLERSFENFTEVIDDIQNAYGKLLQQIKAANQDNTLPWEVLEEMAGNLAHGIRNPLGGITNFISLLSDEIPPEGLKRISKIKEGVERIDTILENLILFSRPMAPQFIKCNVVDVLNAAIRSFEKSTKGDISFRLSDIELLVELDPELMKQAFINILQNSVEAMPEGGEIEISVENGAKDRGLIQFKDNGKGLADADFEKLFLPFYTTKVNGVGLGLALARMVVEKHSGEITLTARETNGAIVAISLPLIRKTSQKPEKNP